MSNKKYNSIDDAVRDAEQAHEKDKTVQYQVVELNGQYIVMTTGKTLFMMNDIKSIYRTK